MDNYVTSTSSSQTYSNFSYAVSNEDVEKFLRKYCVSCFERKRPEWLTYIDRTYLDVVLELPWDNFAQLINEYKDIPDSPPDLKALLMCQPAEKLAEWRDYLDTLIKASSFDGLLDATKSAKGGET